MYRLQRSLTYAEGAGLGEEVTVPRDLVRAVVDFWDDGMWGFPELLILGHWTGTLFGREFTPFLTSLIGHLPSLGAHELGLTSERPDERAAIQGRLRRLRGEPAVAGAYAALVATAWRSIESFWNAEAVHRVDACCTRWRMELDSGAAVLDLLPADHAVHVLGLEQLLRAGLATGRVAVTPCYFGRVGELLDLKDTLLLGVRATGPTKATSFDGYIERGRMIAGAASFLADPTTAAVLTYLLDTAATPLQVAAQLRIEAEEAKRHIQVLRNGGVVSHVQGSSPPRYCAMAEPLERQLNQISAKLNRSHGRATRLHASETAAEASFRAIFNDAPIGIVQLDLEARCLSCNRAAQDVFGYTEAEMTQLRGTHLLFDQSDADVFDIRGQHRGSARREIRLRNRDGSLFWGSVTVASVNDERGEPVFAYAMIEDVSEPRGAKDAVSGLPNRSLFMDRLQRALHAATRDGQGLCLLFLDLDGFKAVNDRLGHQAGDAVLREVGARLTAVLRVTDMAARIGGDEFGVLSVGVTHQSAATDIARKVRTALQQPMVIAGSDVHVGASIGVALAPRDGDTAEQLVACADQAMYVAKRSGMGIHPI